MVGNPEDRFLTSRLTYAIKTCSEDTLSREIVDTKREHLHEKAGCRGFSPGETLSGLLSHRSLLVSVFQFYVQQEKASHYSDSEG